MMTQLKEKWKQIEAVPQRCKDLHCFVFDDEITPRQLKLTSTVAALI